MDTSLEGLVPTQRKSKLMPRGFGTFQVLERIHHNSYKINLPPEYQVHNTLNICDLSPLDALNDGHPINLRTNPPQDRENDMILISSRPLESSLRPFTRSHAKELQGLQAMFTKREVLELVLIPTKGYNVLRINLKSQKRKDESELYCIGVTKSVMDIHQGDWPLLGHQLKPRIVVHHP